MGEARGGETIFVGIDLAWGQKNRTGVVAVASGEVVNSLTLVSDDQICDWLNPYLAGPVLVAVDAPLIVRNPAGTSRPCDRTISRFRRQPSRCALRQPGTRGLLGRS